MTNTEWVSIKPEATLKDALSLMRQKEVHHLLVFSNDQLVGFISDRDVLARGMTSDLSYVRNDLTVEDVMHREIPTFPDSVDTDSIEAKAKFLASNPVGIRLIELLTDIGI